MVNEKIKYIEDMQKLLDGMLDDLHNGEDVDVEGELKKALSGDEEAPVEENPEEPQDDGYEDSSESEPEPKKKDFLNRVDAIVIKRR